MQYHQAIASRELSKDQLHLDLVEARNTTKTNLARWRQLTADPRAPLPIHDEWNLPEWEAGHIAWFQEFWIARNPDRSLGWNANPNAVRFKSSIAESDSLYHSSLIAHDPRWSLPFPDPHALEQYLDQGLEQTLTLLSDLEEHESSYAHSAALYFFRLSLYHEDMHAEAAHYSMNHYLHDFGLMSERMGQSIEWLGDSMQRSSFLDFAEFRDLEKPRSANQLTLQAGERQLGALPDLGFAFDNELPAFVQYVDRFSIDTRPVSVEDYLAFIFADGYQTQRFWSDDGWAWKCHHQAELPRFHRFVDGQIERCCFGKWSRVPSHSPILHVTAYEAEAWCAWAERRLPNEHEWTIALLEHPDRFDWGYGWEWTQSGFAPFHGFVAHPYQDYSQPWFTGHRVLKGASFATHARMQHPTYRNFYVPSRNDIYAGFRTCAR